MTLAATGEPVTYTPWTAIDQPPRRWQAEALPIARRACATGGPVVRACTGAGKTVFTGELAYTAHKAGHGVIIAVPTKNLVAQTVVALQRWPGWRVGAWYSDRHELGDVTVTCYPSLESLILPYSAERQPGLLICDECHGTEAAGRRSVLPMVPHRWRLGLTATPYRGKPGESLSMWDRMVYEYGMADAIADGVLVPPVIRGWDGDEVGVNEAMIAMIRQTEGPGVVNALTVEEGQAFMDELIAAGISAGIVHFKLSAKANAAQIELLRTGVYRCLVHVNLLSEGVDLPWLRWIAIRRPMASKVQIVQYAGRVLRTHPGKTEGVILDPLGCIDEAGGLVHAADLGGSSAEPGEKKQAEAWEPGEPLTLEHLRVKSYPEAERLWRELAVVLQAAGVIEARTRGRWALDPATPKQRDAIGRMGWSTRHLPEPYREPARRLATHPDLRRGAASDLLSILAAGADGGKEARNQRRAWTLPLPDVQRDT